MRMTSKILQLMVVFALGIGPFAIADDGSGVKLISQETVNEAGGFPYKITKPGSYRLVSNLTVPVNLDGIDISANGVTLDLNGFTIAGPGTCFGSPENPCTGNGTGTGIYALADDTSVRNGTVVGFFDGLGLSGLVEDVQAKWNMHFGIYVGIGIVQHCIARKNGTGITIGFGEISNSLAGFNQLNGLFSSGGTVLANTAIENGYFGLFATQVVYGSNNFSGNGHGQVNPFFSSVSQNNNICNGVAC